MSLDFTSLHKATASLERALSRALNAPLDTELRDAVIQRFEYTYELCWKMLKRQLESEVANPSEVDTWSYRDLIRVGLERGILNGFESWMVYRTQRNLTAHTYDENKAVSVFNTASDFLKDAQALLSALEHRHDPASHP